MTHVYFGKAIIIGSDNGLLFGRCQAIIRNNAVKLLIVSLETKFGKILTKFIHFY